jgi:Holliday junction resolvase RusA-like endonuclease
MPDRRRPDLLGLLQATADILEKAQIIDNDRNVVSFDGSRIMGVDKRNPRVEIEIESCEVAR